MNFSGIILGVAAFLCIGIFHPIVIKAEYYFGVKCWWAFLLVGIGGLVGSVLISNIIVSAILGVFACSSLWGILELFQQRERVHKGWFPANPNKKKEN